MINGQDKNRKAGKNARKRNKRKSARQAIIDFISGKILVREEVIRQLPYIIFLTFLAFIYIGNQYHAEKIAIETNRLKRDIKELRSKSISISSELLYMTNQIEISKKLKEEGVELEEATEPPVHIVIEKKAVKSE